MSATVIQRDVRANPRLAVVGAVRSSLETLDTLVKNGITPVGVCALESTASTGVSGYVDLGQEAERLGVPTRYFRKVGDDSVRSWLADLDLDLIFVVGLSQLFPESHISTARAGAIGFHPTLLPAGRGRAPIAWVVSGVVPGAATLFFLDRAADSGPIIYQEPFPVSDDDDVESVSEKALAGLRRGIAAIAKQLLTEQCISGAIQDEGRASYLGIRRPEDGLIDWSATAVEVHRKIRSTSRPYPGAFTFGNGGRIVVWKSSLNDIPPYHGVPGRVLEVAPNGSLLVQCGDKPIWITEFERMSAQSGEAENRVVLRVGALLGNDIMGELEDLRKRIALLEERLPGQAK